MLFLANGHRTFRDGTEITVRICQLSNRTLILKHLLSITIYTQHDRSRRVPAPCFSCLTTVPPKGTDMYNRGELHLWVPANIYLNIGGSVGPFFASKRLKKTKDGLYVASGGGQSKCVCECTILSLPVRSQTCAAIDYSHDSCSSHDGAHAIDNVHRYTHSKPHISCSVWLY